MDLQTLEARRNAIGQPSAEGCSFLSKLFYLAGLPALYALVFYGIHQEGESWANITTFTKYLLICLDLGCMALVLLACLALVSWEAKANNEALDGAVITYYKQNRLFRRLMAVVLFLTSCLFFSVLIVDGWFFLGAVYLVTNILLALGQTFFNTGIKKRYAEIRLGAGLDYLNVPESGKAFGGNVD